MKRWKRMAPVAVLVLVAGLVVSGPSGASAQVPTCFGRTATIVARPGQQTLGTSGADVIVGTAQADDIRGLGGNDRICAGRGHDRVHGGPGNDRIDTGSGSDTATGGTGRDRLYGRSGHDRLRGGAGRDVIVGGPGRDALRGQSGRDRCTGGRGRDDVRTCDEASRTASFFLPTACLFDAAVWTGGAPPQTAPLAGAGVSSAFAIDLDGNGARGRARVVWCTYGGNAVHHSVHVHDDRGRYLGRIPLENHARPLGQSVAPTILGVDGNEVTIETIGYERGDWRCCPGVETVLRYRWDGSTFRLVELDNARGIVGQATDARDRLADSWNRGDIADLKRFASPQVIDLVRQMRSGGGRLSPAIGSCERLCSVFPEEPYQYFAIDLEVLRLDTGRIVISQARWESTN